VEAKTKEGRVDVDGDGYGQRWRRSIAIAIAIAWELWQCGNVGNGNDSILFGSVICG